MKPWETSGAQVRAILAAIFFIALAGTASAQWRTRTSTDQMTGHQSVIASTLASVPVTNSIGTRETPRLIVRCRENELNVIVTFASSLFSTFDDDGTPAELRVDDEHVVGTSWDSSDDGKGLFYNGAAPYQDPAPVGDQSTVGLIRRMMAGNTLHVRFHPPLNSAQYTRFILSGSTAALEPILRACGVATNEATAPQ
ncbi:MAG: hypothetical protein QM759_07860 [Terricaulis sp.]